MPMKLEGSCQCGGVEFTLQSQTPTPYQLCACSICRKVGGYMGAVNLGGIADSLNILKGKDLIKYEPHSAHPLPQDSRRAYCSINPTRYSATSMSLPCTVIDIVSRKYSAIKNRGTADEEVCSSERNFCSNCSTMLWLWDHHWPELIHPFASAIDTELPVPDEMVCIMEGSKPAWARWPEGKKSVHESYGADSLEQWHKRHGLFVE
ncbi:Glutathione-dependent formaldehyde-activating enzyme/centromere protein V [Penicillium sp. DV-2018c]|nr:Glutathione-dependent formaldehyde-activating enzyme/centromere protein V [Penicillium sp. DV-2018c]